MDKKRIDWWRGGFVSPFTFTPFAWWDNGATYMASDGSQWTEKVRGYNVTSSGTARPTFTTNAVNGLPSYTFDAVNDVMSRSRITEMENLSGLTLWAVGNKYSLAQDDESTTTGRINLLNYQADNKIYGVLDGANQGNATVASAFNYAVMVFDGTLSGNSNRLKIWRNGVQLTLTFAGTVLATTGSNAASTFKFNKFNTVFQAGQSCEYGIITSAITGTQVTELNSYLAAKYAL